MRISDWSSDVCSSDLPPAPPASGRGGLARRPDVARRIARLARFGMLGEFDARDRAFVHFVGTVGEPPRALMPISPGHPGVPGHAGPPLRLGRTVTAFPRPVRHLNLAHPVLGTRRLVAAGYCG